MGSMGLPEDISRLRDRLLALWLGAENGATLSRRVVAEGLLGTVVSGYDLRLFADLAAVDPEWHVPYSPSGSALVAGPERGSHSARVLVQAPNIIIAPVLVHRRPCNLVGRKCPTPARPATAEPNYFP